MKTSTATASSFSDIEDPELSEVLEAEQAEAPPSSAVSLAAPAESPSAPASAPALGAGLALSGFVRDAIREKATRELASLGASLDAFGRLLSVASSLGVASSDLTALLGGLSAIAADSGTIGRAKKLRKLLDEARDAAESLVESTGVEQRRIDAEEKRQMLMSELSQAGIALDVS